jgi:hypothetical protein
MLRQPKFILLFISSDVPMTLDPVMLGLAVGAFLLFLGYVTLLSRL